MFLIKHGKCFHFYFIQFWCWSTSFSFYPKFSWNSKPSLCLKQFKGWIYFEIKVYLVSLCSRNIFPYFWLWITNLNIEDARKLIIRKLIYRFKSIYNFYTVFMWNAINNLQFVFNFWGDNQFKIFINFTFLQFIKSKPHLYKEVLKSFEVTQFSKTDQMTEYLLESFFSWAENFSADTYDIQR